MGKGSVGTEGERGECSGGSDGVNEVSFTTVLVGSRAFKSD